MNCLVVNHYAKAIESGAPGLPLISFSLEDRIHERAKMLRSRLNVRA